MKKPFYNLLEPEINAISKKVRDSFLDFKVEGNVLKIPPQKKSGKLWVETLEGDRFYTNLVAGQEEYMIPTTFLQKEIIVVYTENDKNKNRT